MSFCNDKAGPIKLYKLHVLITIENDLQKYLVLFQTRKGKHTVYKT